MEESEVASELRGIRNRLHDQGAYLQKLDLRLAVIEVKVAGASRIAFGVAIGSIPTVLTLLFARGTL